MRHGIAGNRLGRNSTLRKATIRDVAKATLIRQRIQTTKAIAKEARKLVDRLITLGKKGELAHKRRAFEILCDHSLVSNLFNKISPRFRSRNGGYTRIIPLGYRRGDNARLVFLELTEKEIIAKPKVKADAGKKSKVVDAEITPVAESSAEVSGGVKESAPKSKPAPKKHIPTEDKGKSGKKIVGGIKKIFQRKMGGE